MIGKIHKKAKVYMLKNILALMVLFSALFTAQGQVTHLFTDYNGFWHSGSGTGNVSSIRPDYSHDLLAFTHNGTTYSTGVNDQLLSQYGVSFVPGIYQALPVVNIPIPQGGSRFAQLGQMQDGIHNGVKSTNPAIPYPYNTTLPVRLSDMLTDGINGLDIGSGVTNMMYADGSRVNMEFPFTMIAGVNEIGDGIPDILISQIAQPQANNIDEAWFVDQNGNMVGNSISINQTNLSVLGVGMYDFFNPDGSAAGGNFINSSRDIRMSAYDASAFGLNASNYTLPRKLIYRLGGSSDPAFIAFNYRFLAIVVANADHVTTNVNTPITINPLSNDLIPSAVILQSLEIVSGEEPTHGNVVVNPNNTVTYTPNSGYIGIDRFRYRICSNTNSCDEAYVDIVIGASDIAVTKSISPTAPSIGSPLTFTVTVSNNGPHNAVGVRVIDLLPAGYNFTSASVTGGSYSNASGNWIVGDLAVGASRTLTINATLRTTGPYTNTATASSLMYDPDPSNNEDHAIPATVPSALVRSECTVGQALQQVVVDLTGEPGWTVNFTYNGTAYTQTGITSSPFIYHPPERGIFYVTSVTAGNGSSVSYPTTAPLDIRVRSWVYNCQVITNPMLPSKVSGQ